MEFNLNEKTTTTNSRFANSGGFVYATGRFQIIPTAIVSGKNPALRVAAILYQHG